MRLISALVTGFAINTINAKTVRKFKLEKDQKAIFDESISVDSIDSEKDIGLFYQEYLERVEEALQRDPHFQRLVKTLDPKEVMQGGMKGINIHQVSVGIRKELDQIKREEIDRIKHIIRASNELNTKKGISAKMQEKYLDGIADHFHHESHTFKEADLVKLMKAATSELRDFDKERHMRFKHYEMYKKMREDQKLGQMSSKEKEDYIEIAAKRRRMHLDHEKVNFPGSKAMLEEIWNYEDMMEDEDWNPETFFNIHDKNTDGYLDAQEVEDLMTHELNKMYDSTHTEDDMVEQGEERLRMREQFFNEMDTNKDMMISKREFLEFTANDEDFEHPERKWGEWKTIDDMIDDGMIYDDDELKDYRIDIDREQRNYKKIFDQFQKEDEDVRALGNDVVRTQEDMEATGELIKDPKAKKYLLERERELLERQDKLNDLSRQIATMDDSLKQMKTDYKNHEKLAEYSKAKQDPAYAEKIGHFGDRGREAQRIVNQMAAEYKHGDL